MAEYDVQSKALDQKSDINVGVKTTQMKSNNSTDFIQMAKVNQGMLKSSEAMALQRKIGNKAVSQLVKNNEANQNNIIQKKSNNTGLPNNLKTGIESLSGVSMDGIKVHYNSNKPNQLGALAYAQGKDIFVGAGQEKHLPHEAWHVVQQAKGRVQPTMMMKGIGVNTDQGLEMEADRMGEKVLGVTRQFRFEGGINSLENNEFGIFNSCIQRKMIDFRPKVESYTPPKGVLKKEMPADYKTYIKDNLVGLVNENIRPKVVEADFWGERGNEDNSCVRKPGITSKVGCTGRDEFFIRYNGTDEKFEGGHLIGHQFLDDKKFEGMVEGYHNLVPMSRYVNIGPFGKFETFLEENLNTLMGDKNKVITVHLELEYEDYKASIGDIKKIFNINKDESMEEDDGDENLSFKSYIPKCIIPTMSEKMIYKNTYDEDYLSGRRLTPVDYRIKDNQLRNLEEEITTGEQLIDVLSKTPILSKVHHDLFAKLKGI